MAGESSTVDRQPPMGDFMLEQVTNGVRDIAKTAYLEKMMTEATGRRPFQQVYLWTPSEDEAKRKTTGKGATTTKYEAARDGPTAHSLCPKLPQNEELIPAERTKLYLEVGLIIGDDVDKYEPKDNSRDLKREQERQKRGKLRRDPGAMRVFIPVTDYIADQAKYYVGCRFTAGRLYPRLIKGTNIFFYPEFWTGLDENLRMKERRQALNTACKLKAAINKSPPERMVAPITKDMASKVLASHPLAATRAEHTVSTLVFQWYLYKIAKDHDYLQGMRDTMDRAAPELRYGPRIVNDGIDAFMDFGEDLKKDEAEMVATELKDATPRMATLQPDIIQRIHHVLRLDEDSDEPGNLPLRDQLNRGMLGFFLEICHLKITSADFAVEVVRDIVKDALQLAQLHQNHTATIPSSSFAAWTDSGPAGDRPIAADLHLVLTTMREFIKTMDKYVDDSAKLIAEQHGAILKHANLKDLMSKIGDAVDTAAMKSLVEQLGALHATVYASKNREVVNMLRAADEFLERILMVNECNLSE